MTRRAGPIAAALATVLALAPVAAHRAGGAPDAPTGWDGTNPFACTLQQAGFDATGDHPEADPYCVEFDKRRQNVDQLGVVEFLSKEPARVAAASPKCFYFQSDHWRGSLVQDDGTTKTYEWDGHYFFDKARGEGGAWVTNFNVNGRTGDPSAIPGIPEEYDRYLGPGTGGMRTQNGIDADPQCVARAEAEPERIYAVQPAAAPPSSSATPACASPGAAVSPRAVGDVEIGAGEQAVRRRLGPPGSVRRGFLRWCVAQGGQLRVGQHGDRSGELGSGDAATVMLLTTSRLHRYRDVGPGTSTRTFRRRFPRARRVADSTWATRPRSPVLVRITGGRVRSLVVYDRREIRTRAGLRAFLERAR
jgi:hypothetical protein